MPGWISWLKECPAQHSNEWLGSSNHLTKWQLIRLLIPDPVVFVVAAFHGPVHRCAKLTSGVGVRYQLDGVLVGKLLELWRDDAARGLVHLVGGGLDLDSGSREGERMLWGH